MKHCFGHLITAIIIGVIMKACIFAVKTGIRESSRVETRSSTASSGNTKPSSRFSKNHEDQTKVLLSQTVGSSTNLINKYKKSDSFQVSSKHSPSATLSTNIVEEIMRSEKRKLYSKGKPNSQGLDFSIEIPSLFSDAPCVGNKMIASYVYQLMKLTEFAPGKLNSIRIRVSVEAASKENQQIRAGMDEMIAGISESRRREVEWDGVESSMPGTDVERAGIIHIKNKNYNWMQFSSQVELPGTMGRVKSSMLYRNFTTILKDGRGIEISFGLAGPNIPMSNMRKEFEKVYPLIQQTLSSLMLNGEDVKQSDDVKDTSIMDILKSGISGKNSQQTSCVTKTDWNSFVKFERSDLAKIMQSPMAKYYTKDNPKSHGIDISLQYPTALNSQEPNAAHMLRKFLYKPKNRDMIMARGVETLSFSVSVVPQSLEDAANHKDTVNGFDTIKKESNENELEYCAWEGVPVEVGDSLFNRFGIIELINKTFIWQQCYNTKRMSLPGCNEPINFCTFGRTYNLCANDGTLVCFYFTITGIDVSEDFLQSEFMKLRPLIFTALSSVTYLNRSQFEKPQIGEVGGNGTGWAVSPMHLMTCWHVVKGASKISFIDDTGREINLRLVDRNEKDDLAVLTFADSELSTVPRLEPLALAASDVKISEKVFTCGFPNPELQGQKIKYTEGVVSSSTGYFDAINQFQMTTPIQGGNSGGPMFNNNCEVVGIASARYESFFIAKATNRDAQNINYAVKISRAKKLLETSSIKYRLGNSTHSNSHTDNVKKLSKSIFQILVR